MENMADKLFAELVVAAIVLMGIMLYNNIVLYKIKINDLLTQIIISTMIMSVSELVVNITQNKKDLIWLNYLSLCTVTLASLAVGAILLRYVLVKLDCDLKKKWQKTVIFYIPNLLLFLLCVTTPWTKQFYYIDEEYICHVGDLYYIYIAFLVLYVILAFVVSFVIMLRSQKHDIHKRHAAETMLFFVGLVFIMYLIPVLMFGSDSNSDYIPAGVVWALPVVYLTTNMNVNTLINNRTRAAAIQADLDIASKIQTDALPKIFPPYEHHPEIELYASMDTAKEVGGDFYDCFEIDDRRICFVMADVSGKGVPAALFMMTAKTMIKDYAMLKSSTGEIFTSVNKYLSENNETGMFATAWIGIIDTKNMTLQYTNAGHNYPFIAHSGGDFTELKKKHGLFLAGMDDTEYSETEIQLQEGDTLFLFTDGLTEAHNSEDELYDTKRLVPLLNSVSDRGGKTLLPEIKHSVDEFAGSREQFDDITMMVIRIK